MPTPTAPGAVAAVDLYWLPLGADGVVVRVNGRIFEGLCALRDRRRPLELYHAALAVVVPDGRFTIELTPVPDGDGAARGVVREGPVGLRWLGRFRVFRYELRRWRGGTIPDLEHAVASPVRLTEDPVVARAVLTAAATVPTLVWGRDELHAGEMWNSNAVIAWLLATGGVHVETVTPPPGGRAPGWNAGVVVARRRGGSAAGRVERPGGRRGGGWLTPGAPRRRPPVSDQTALENARLVVRGERGELAVDQGRITISKQAPTRDAPTTVEFGVDQVRGTDLQAPSRGARGWLHVGVVGGSPAPPGDLAAAGDPYTLPLTSRSVGSARRFVKLVDRHVQARGMPRETGPSAGRLSSSVAITRAPVTPRPTTAPEATPAPTSPPPPPPPPPSTPGPVDLVAELQALAELHGDGALTDEEFERAKARLLG